MGRAIGIDLGTTNTAVAVMRDGRPRVLEDDKGYNVFSSCISLTDEGGYLIGATAKSLIMTRPDRTVSAIKRLMGRRFDSPQSLQAQRRMGYEIAESDAGLCDVVVGSQRMTPIEVSARILAEARRLAENALGEPVDQAVITVPAYFNHAQRQSTIEAAGMAGLRCERLLNEPTAAALAYGFRRNYDRTIVVYDLGGGTFDVSILQLASGVYETLATRGDTYLGGEDFDFRLVDHLADDFQNRYGVDLRDDVVALQRLKDAAERAKCELSFTDSTTVLIPRVTASRNLEMTIDRLTLEGLVDDLVERTLDVTRKSLTDAGLQISDIDDVILVGGQTRMPRVREAISGMFQKEPSRGVHPEEVVAIGAAVHAGALVDDTESATILLDVTPFNLGLDLAGGLFRPIIIRNTHVPISATQKFSTARENQDAVRIVIRQGESKVAVENEFLSEFLMTSLTPGENLRCQVEVTFRIDSNGMLHVSAMEPTTGERKKITVRNYAQFASQGGGALELEGEGSTTPGGSGAAPEPTALDAETAPESSPESTTPAAAKPAKVGFFRGLFRRDSKPAAPAEAAAPAEEPEASEPTEVPSPAADVVPEVPLVEPEPLPLVEPEPLPLVEPEPLPLVEPEPLPLVEPEPLSFIEPEPLPLVEPEPLPLVEPEPLSFVEPEPLAEPEPLPFTEPERDASVSGGSPPSSVPAEYQGSEVRDIRLVGGDPGLFSDDDLDMNFSSALSDLDQPMEPSPAEIMTRAMRERPEDFADISDFDDFGVPELDGDEIGGLNALDLSGFGSPEQDLSDLSALSDAADGGSFDLGELGDFSEDDGLNPSVDESLTTQAPPAAESPSGPEEEIDLGDFDDLFSAEDDIFSAEDDGLNPEEELDLGDLDFGEIDLKLPEDEPAASDAALEELSSEVPDLGDLGLDDLGSDDLGSDDLGLGDLDSGGFDSGDLFTDDFGSGDLFSDDLGSDDLGLGDLDSGDLGSDDLGLGDLGSGDLFSDEPAGDGFGTAAPEDVDSMASSSSIDSLDDLPEDGLDLGSFDDLFGAEADAGATRIAPAPEPAPEPTPQPQKRKKPARLKLSYRRLESLVREYRANLAEGGSFVKTNRPLRSGRECCIILQAPGLDEPLSIPGVVAWSSADEPNATKAGMHIDYTLSDEERSSLQAQLSGLG